MKRSASTEKLLNLLAAQGEMSAQEFLAHVPRVSGDYLDFYPAAALMHANYIESDSDTNRSGQSVVGKIGTDIQETAIMFCQIALPPGKSFKINNVPRDSWHDFPCRIFITADGYLRLDELEQRRIERRRKRVDYIVSLAIAVLAALLSSYLIHYYTLKRLQIERGTQQTAPVAAPITAPSP